MSLTNTAQAKLLFEKMRYTQARQEMTSDNLARAGVAGEKAKEMDSFTKAMKGKAYKSSLKKTNEGHLTGRATQKDFSVKKSKGDAETTLSGNNISPEEQLLALNEASTDFFRLEQINKNEKTRIRLIASLGSGK